MTEPTKYSFETNIPSQDQCLGLRRKLCKQTPDCEWELQPLKEGEKRKRGLCKKKEGVVVDRPSGTEEAKTDRECENPILRDSSFNERVELDSWVLNNRKRFLPFLKSFEAGVVVQQRTNLKRWDDNTNTFIEDTPLIHQKFVSDYLSDKTPYRGLLLYHGLGSGKSGAGIMTAEGFIGRQIVVLLPKSLRKNYEDEIKRFGDIPYKEQSYWCFNEILLFHDETLNVETYERFTNQGISKELLKRVVNLNGGGIWMIDRSKEPNFNSLEESKQIQIKKQIELMYNYKYTFIHYNMGASLVTHLLKTFYPNHNDIKRALFDRVKMDSEINVRNNDKDKLSILDHIYNPQNNLENPFSHKVVVIDEIHNLTSQMAGGGINGPILYELLMRAENCKLILLSGTPVINSAYELGLLFNILNGYTLEYTFSLTNTNGNWKKETLEQIVRDFRLVDRVKMNIQEKSLSITRNPYGFISTIDDNRLVPDNRNQLSNKEFITTFTERLLRHNYIVDKEPTTIYYNLFPDMLNPTLTTHTFLSLKNSKQRELSEEVFNSQYIDYDKFGVSEKYKLLFQSKIVGLVSFYNEISGVDEQSGSNFFPTLLESTDEETDIYMSDYQFSLYTRAREEERELEERSKRNAISQMNAGDVGGKSASLFRVLSRQTGLFVFPPSIVRPRPKHFKKNPTETEDVDRIQLFNVLDSICKTQNPDQREIVIREFMELIGNNRQLARVWRDELYDLVKDKVGETKDEEENYTNWTLKLCEEHGYLFNDDTGEEALDITYQEALMEAVAILDKQLLKVVNVGDVPYGLDILSPKYLKILENISNTEGLVFCYSQFRNVEGIEMFKHVLLANGYSELIVDKTTGASIRDDTIHIGGKVRYSINEERTIWRTGTIIEVVEDDDIRYRLTDLPDGLHTDVGGWSVEDVSKWLSFVGLNTFIKKFKEEGITGLVLRTMTSFDFTECDLSMTDSIKLTSLVKSIHDTTKLYNREELYKCHFSLWTGTEEPIQRDIAKNIFNGSDNKWGQKCLLLIASSSGSEGISLMNVRQVHILETYWNNVRLDQVIGRARRIKSHIELPREQQNVKVFKYIIKLTPKQIDGTWGATLNIEDLKQLNPDLLPERLSDILTGEHSQNIDRALGEIRQSISSTIREKDNSLTSDQTLLQISNKKSKILREFLKLIQESAIDCQFNKIDNIKSNPDLSNLQCLSVIPTIGNNTTPYNYKLENTLIKDTNINSKTATTKDNYKIFMPRLKLKSGDIKYVVILPEQYKNIGEYMRTHPDKELPIYDFYIYYNINKQNLQQQFKIKVQIGHLYMDSNQQIKTQITNLNHFKIYSQIEQHIKKSGINPYPPKQDVDIIQWSEQVRQLQHEPKSTDDIMVGEPVEKSKAMWECLMCSDKPKYTEDILICPICKKGTKRIWELVKEQEEKSAEMERSPRPTLKKSNIAIGTFRPPK